MPHRRRYGGEWWDVFDPNKNGVAAAFQPAAIQQAFAPLTNEFTNPNSVLRSDLLPKLQNELVNPDSVFRAEIIPAAQTAAALAGYGRRRHGRGRSGGAWYDDAGRYATQGADLFRRARHEYVDPKSYSQQFVRGARDVGRAMGLQGFGRQRRSYPGDGRAKRGAIVRQVMMQNPGMSLPQASAYVKAQGMY